MKYAKYIFLFTFILLLILYISNPKVPNEKYTIIDTSFGLVFHEYIYDLSNAKIAYNISTEQTLTSQDDILCLYNSYSINNYVFNIYRNKKDELVISYNFNNIDTIICKITTWGEKENLLQLESSILDPKNNICQITTFDNLLKHNGICISIVESPLVVNSFYIETDNSPELFLFTDSGTLSLEDINSDNCYELVSSTDAQYYFFKNNTIHKINTTYKDDVKQLYYDKNTKKFIIYYNENKSQIVDINFDTYHITSN